MPNSYKVAIDDSLMRFQPNDQHFVEKIEKELPFFAEFKHKNVKTAPMRRRLFAWIAIMYDPNTPLRRELKDLYKRKVYAGNLVGFKVDGRLASYQEWIEDIFAGQDDKINELIAKFIASFSSPEYMQLMGHVAMLEASLQRIIAGTADKSTQTMFDASTEMVRSLTNFIYGTGETEEVARARRALYKQVAFDLSDTRPERVARSMASGEGLPDDWSPYEEGYLPGDIRFVGDDPNIAKDDEESI